MELPIVRQRQTRRRAPSNRLNIFLKGAPPPYRAGAGERLTRNNENPITHSRD